MHGSARQKADIDSKPEIIGALPGAERVTRKSPESPPFWKLPWSVAAICDLSSGPKILFAKMWHDAFDSTCCWVGIRLHADSLGVDRGTIRRWVRELERWGLIWVEREWGCCAYHLNTDFMVGKTIPLLVETMKRRDIGWGYKLLLCCLSYRQGENDFCWPKQKVLAEELGLSMRTIQRLLAGIKAKGEVQIRPRRYNRRGGNKYALTCGAVLGGRVFGRNSHTTKSPPLYKKRIAKSYFKALRAKFPPGDLSASSSKDWFGPEAVYIRLVNIGVHEKVARPLAFDQKHPFGSVVQAIHNALILRAVVWKRFEDAGLPRPKFNVAGYVVNALNGARREGKTIGTTKIFRQAAAMSRVIKMAKARRRRDGPPSKAEIADRVHRQKRALGVTA